LQGLFEKNSKYFLGFGEKNEKNRKKALDKRRGLCYNIKLHYNCRTSENMLCKNAFYRIYFKQRAVVSRSFRRRAAGHIMELE